MSLFITLIVPYVIALFSFVMTSVFIPYQDAVEALVIGCLIGLWFLNVKKVEGYKPVLLLLGVTLVLFVLLDGLCLMYDHVLLDIFVLCTILQCFVIYSVYKNRPRLSMSYKFSYKDSKRRYF